MLPSDRDWLCIEPNGSIRLDGPLPGAILAGSFNPLHEGHRQLAAVAARLIGRPVSFEISIVNVDKPEMEAEEVRRRTGQFAGLAPIYVTRARTFEEKANLFPNSVLVVGADTAIRIVDPRYYANNTGRRDESLKTISERGCRFLVAGRSVVDGRFLSLDAIAVPAEFCSLFDAIAESDFRLNVSSTGLRR